MVSTSSSSTTYEELVKQLSILNKRISQILDQQKTNSQIQDQLTEQQIKSLNDILETTKALFSIITTANIQEFMPILIQIRTELEKGHVLNNDQKVTKPKNGGFIPNNLWLRGALVVTICIILFLGIRGIQILCTTVDPITTANPTISSPSILPSPYITDPNSLSNNSTIPNIPASRVIVQLVVPEQGTQIINVEYAKHFLLNPMNSNNITSLGLNNSNSFSEQARFLAQAGQHDFTFTYQGGQSGPNVPVDIIFGMRNLVCVRVTSFDDSIPVRSESNGTSTVIASLPEGSPVFVTQRYGEYRAIRVPITNEEAIRGWVFEGDLVVSHSNNGNTLYPDCDDI